MGVDIEFKFPDWGGKLAARRDELDRFQAAIIQTNRGMLFDAEGNDNGHVKWAPLRLRSGQVLSRRGALRRSIAPYAANGQPGPDGIVRFSGNEITIGTKLFYAAMMNWGTTGLPGGVLRPKNAKALKIPLPSGESANKRARSLRARSTAKSLVNISEKIANAKANLASARAKASARKKPSKTASATISRIEKRLAALQKKSSDAKARLASIKKTGKGGDNFIFRKSVRIPARRFDEWNEQDQAELNESLSNKIAEVLNS